MRRILLIVCVLAVAAGAFVAAGAGGGGGGYQVRAIFDSAAFVVPGEDVKVAGVRVGSIGSLSVTPDNRAAVVLNISDPGYQDFRQDASCTIRPQSLIGEQFVECTPTQPRGVGQQPPPPLRRIQQGDGEGQYLLDHHHTSTSVGLDLIGNTMRLPERQRLSLIVNELGIGLAGRGGDVNDVVRRAAPALTELDKVLNLVARQNRTLKQLAVDSDTVLAPLARERTHVSGFIEHSATVARATAEKQAALRASLQRFPRFLAELRPTMVRLGGLADQMTPVVTDLHAQAADLNDLLRQMEPFSRAGIPALTRLGAVAEPGIPAIRASIPIVKDLRSLASQLRPVGATLAEVLTSFQRNQGLQRLLDYVYYQALAVNGYDSVSHYLRAGLIVNTCSTYATHASPECSANFHNAGASSAGVATASKADGYDLILRRTAMVLAGMSPKKVLRLTGGEKATRQAEAQAEKNLRASVRAQRRQASPKTVPLPVPSPAAGAAPAPPAAATATPAPTATPDQGQVQQLLDYLLGGDGR